MSITLQTNGVDYDGFTTVSVYKSFKQLSNAFTFTVVSSQNIQFPIKLGDKCVIRVNNKPVITGFIEKLNITYSNDEHTIVLEGRDQTCDLIDSTINNKIVYSPPITLKQIIENIISTLGIPNMKVIENVQITPFSQSEIQSAKIGDTYFKFIDSLCRLRQVIVTTDGLGNVLLDQSSTKKINTVLMHKINNNFNTVLSSNSAFDYTKRFSTYRVFSQGNNVAFKDIPQTVQQITNKQGATATDPEIRATRQFNFIAEKASDDKDLKNRAIWEANIRRAESKVYNCRAQGFVAQNDNILWSPNLLVQVNDDFAQTEGLFLIKDVTYTLTTKGSYTDLALVVQDAFTLHAEQDARDAKTNKQGTKFVV